MEWGGRRDEGQGLGMEEEVEAGSGSSGRLRMRCKTVGCRILMREVVMPGVCRPPPSLASPSAPS